MQSLAVQISALFLLLLAACFVWVLGKATTRVPLEQVAPAAYRARSKLFIVALIAGVLIALLTLAPWPHDAHASEVTRRIDVKARQWAWDLSDAKAQVGEVIEFRVSSEDVNHGFALYDAQQKIVAQIQAMPGFVNTVRYRFDSPGTYQILCLEFCGVAHHAMVAELNVTAQP